MLVLRISAIGSPEVRLAARAHPHPMRFHLYPLRLACGMEHGRALVSAAWQL